MKNKCLVFFAALCIAWSLNSCKKDSFITSPDASLRISADSIKFDTVFTTTGSVTQSFKIVNENDQKLRLENIKLMGGSNSAFRININGSASNDLNNVEIAANDSIYVFVAVSINPSAANLPFIINDSISIQYNGNQRWVQLEAYGQNAHFLNSESISSNTTWPNDKPYVILGFLQVAQGATLTIAPGTKIYANANAPIVVDGTLLAQGIINEPIIFSGDRLDEPYKNFPGSWPGIFFRSSSINNQLQFVQVKNAYQAIVVQNPASNGNPKLVIQQSIIDNAFNAGIFSSNSSIQASNLLISNCANNIYIEAGGQYEFNHCTVASYSSSYLLHKTPVLTALNYNSQASANLQANFTNCIFWGSEGFLDNEIVVNKQGSNSFSVNFTNCLYRAQANPVNAVFVASLRNIDPQFDSIDVGKRMYDFHHATKPSAPGIDKGVASSINKDLDDEPRPVVLPDIGCYEKQ